MSLMKLSLCWWIALRYSRRVWFDRMDVFEAMIDRAEDKTPVVDLELGCKWIESRSSIFYSLSNNPLDSVSNRSDA